MAKSCPIEPAPLAEPARAKVNLSLQVLGRRPDGYHELESLVMFAEAPAADRVTLVPGGALSLDICGPGAAVLPDAQSNLVVRAADAAVRLYPGLRVGAFRLEKHLPMAAGLGGGSADAAAALRLIRRANPVLAATIGWTAIAASVGADVPVCMASRASLMTGLGERVVPLVGMPSVWAVLANPGVPLETREVFRALGAPPLGARRPAPPPEFADLAELIAGLSVRPNDLEATAERLCPSVAEVRAALSHLDGALLSRMSGSGPTCFALFAAPEAAEAGARDLRSAKPGWWVEAARLG